MQIIDILVTVDGAKLAQKVQEGSLHPGSQQAPTSLGSWNQSDVLIAMVAQNNFATNEQGKSELTVQANSGDTIRWTMTTFGNDMDRSAYLYNHHFNHPNVMSDVMYLPIQTNSYLPSSSNPEGPLGNYNNHVYAAQATVLAPHNTVQYTLSFALVDNYGHNIGYFTWDPFIKVV